MLKRLFLSGLLSVLMVGCSSETEDDRCTILPVATDISDEVRRGHVVTLDVLASASGGGCGELQVIGFSSPEHGSVAREGNQLVYMPARSFLGEDRFEFQVADDAGEASAEVTIAVYEELQLQGAIVLPPVLSGGFAELEDVQVELAFADGSSPLGAEVTAEGEYSLALRVYDDESPSWAVLNVHMQREEDGLLRSTSMHSVVPARAQLLALADNNFVIDAKALPGLTVSAYSSAFWAATQLHLQGDMTETHIGRASLTVSAERLQQLAVLNSALVDGLWFEHDVALDRTHYDFIDVVSSPDAVEALHETVREAALAQTFGQSLLDHVTQDIVNSELETRHLALNAQLPWWLRGYGASYVFETGGMAKMMPATPVELSNYVRDGSQLQVSAIWQSAQLLYAAAGSTWWSVVDEDGTSRFMRLLNQEMLATGDAQFTAEHDWVLPATAGEAMALYYQFAEDGTFRASHVEYASAGALLEGAWTISDNNRLLTLDFEGNSVHMRFMQDADAMLQVRIEDMQNGALRVGPAVRVDDGLTELAWFDDVATRTLRSLFEMRDPDNWRGRELLVPPTTEVVLFDDGSGVIGFNSDTNTPLRWQQVSANRLPAVLRMSVGEGSDFEQRRNWVPLQLKDGALWVLEWVEASNIRGELQLTTPPRVNLYQLPE